MKRKTSRPKGPKKTEAKERRFAFELTRKELFLWLGVAFFAMVWMFTLGVIVGRGLSPVRFDIEKLKKELVALKEQALEQEEMANQLSAKTLSEQTELGFYDLLADKKEEARLRSAPRTEEDASRPTAKSTTRPDAEANSVQTVSETKKQKQGPGPSSVAEKASVGSFTLQVASLKDETRAQKIVTNLKSKGYAAYAVIAHVSGKGSYHRVRVGHFKDRHEAKEMAARLSREELEPIVIRE